MLGYVGLIALAMFAWQAWRSKGGRDRPPPSQTAADSETGADGERPGALKEDEVRILPREAEDVAVDPLADDDDQGTTIPSEWLATIQDNTVGIRRSEADAYYRILAKVRSLPDRDLEAEAVSAALYANLMESPAKFRGRPVTVVGELRSLYEYPEGENASGVRRLYEAWIVTADSGNQPYRVVCQAIPPGWKLGENLSRPVKVTGYFFKKEGYEAKSRTVQVAPTLLANRLTEHVPPQVTVPAEDMAPWMAGLIVVIGLAMLATVIGFALGDARARRRRKPVQDIDAAEAALLAASADRRLSVEESLRRLARDESTASLSRDGEEVEQATAGLTEGRIDLPTPPPPTRTPPRWERFPERGPSSGP
jgi:hypothetical protein